MLSKDFIRPIRVGDIRELSDGRVVECVGYRKFSDVSAVVRIKDKVIESYQSIHGVTFLHFDFNSYAVTGRSINPQEIGGIPVESYSSRSTFGTYRVSQDIDGNEFCYNFAYLMSNRKSNKESIFIGNNIVLSSTTKSDGMRYNRLEMYEMCKFESDESDIIYLDSDDIRTYKGVKITFNKDGGMHTVKIFNTVRIKNDEYVMYQYDNVYFAVKVKSFMRNLSSLTFVTNSNFLARRTVNSDIDIYLVQQKLIGGTGMYIDSCGYIYPKYTIAQILSLTAEDIESMHELSKRTHIMPTLHRIRKSSIESGNVVKLPSGSYSIKDILMTDNEYFKYESLKETLNKLGGSNDVKSYESNDKSKDSVNKDKESDTLSLFSAIQKTDVDKKQEDSSKTSGKEETVRVIPRLGGMYMHKEYGLVYLVSIRRDKNTGIAFTMEGNKPTHTINDLDLGVLNEVLK